MNPWEQYADKAEPPTQGPWNNYKQSDPVSPTIAVKNDSRAKGEAAMYSKAQDHAARMESDPYYRTANESGFLKNAAAQAGGVAYGLGYLGPKQLIGKAAPAEIEDYKASMRGSRDAPGGTTGGVAGYAGFGAPAFMLPGANTVLGSAALGTGLGILEPVGKGESRGRNAALGGFGAATGNLGGRLIGGQLSGRVSTQDANLKALASRNSVKDATLAASQKAGYVVPPSMGGHGAKGRILEALSGKYKTNQLAGIKNDDVTQTLARRAVGLPDDAPMTSEAMQSIRAQAYRQGYEPVAKSGTVLTDQYYSQALSDISSKYVKAARSFPGAVDDNISKMVDTLRTRSFDAGDAIEMSQILRDKANAAFKGGDSGLGKATKDAAKALEDQIERHLEFAGKDGAAMLKGFRDSRTLMAKTHTVEKAIQEGGGKIDALKIGGELQRGKPLTGDLKTIGQFSNNFRDVAGLPKSGHANDFTVLDMAASVGGLGAGNIPLAAMPLSRAGARRLILNPAYQSSRVLPNYNGSSVLRGASALTNNPYSQIGFRLGLPGLLTAQE